MNNHDDGLKPPMIPLVAKSVPPLTRQASEPPERVLLLLDQARRRKVSFINSAEGYGKTTVLTEWYRRLRQEGLNVVWFTCDRLDTDSDRFWMNFHYAVSMAFGDVGVPSYEQLTSLPLPDAIYTLANSLCLAAASQGGLYVIIERFDLIEGSRSLDGLMMLVAALSDDVHLVFSSRKVYSKYDFSSTIGSDAPLTISTSDLAFTKDELAAEIACRTGIDVDPCLIDVAFEKTQGWPLAVNVLADRISACVDPAIAVEDFSGSDANMWDFFEHEVFANLPSELQDFLTRTSFLGLLNAHMCSYVLDCDAAPFINELHRRNLFVAPIDASRERFVRHPLFSHWLVASRMASLSDIDLRHLNARAANWSQRHNLPIAAAKHMILASEREDILELGLTAYPYMTPQDVLSQTFFHRTPDEAAVHPLFMMMAAWAYAYAVDVDNMRIWIEKLRQREGEDASEPVLLSLEVLEVKGLCLECRFEEGIALATKIEPRLKGPQYKALLVLLTNCQAEAFDHQGMFSQGLAKHRAFASLTNSESFSFLSAINQYEIAYSYYEQGMLDQASQLCKSLEASIPDDHPVRGAVMALFVMMDIIRGVWQGEDDSLTQARKLVSKRRNADMYLDWCVSRAWAFAAQGNIVSAEETLLEAVSMVKMSLHAIPRGTSIIPFQSLALLHLFNGNPKGAAEVYVDFDRIGLPGTAYSVLVRRYVELVASDEAGSEPFLMELIEEARSRNYQILVLDLSIDVALLRFSRGQRTRAVRLLHELLEYAASAQIVSPFIWRKASVRPLLVAYITTAKSDYARRSFVQRLLRRPEFASEAEGDEAVDMVGLTSRERDILKLAIEGLSRQEMAEELYVSESTIKSHLSHMYSKFGVSKFKELIAVASDLGL